jgi:hypothetical protein
MTQLDQLVSALVEGEILWPKPKSPINLARLNNYIEQMREELALMKHQPFNSVEDYVGERLGDWDAFDNVLNDCFVDYENEKLLDSFRDQITKICVNAVYETWQNLRPCL